MAPSTSNPMPAGTSTQNSEIHLPPHGFNQTCDFPVLTATCLNTPYLHRRTVPFTNREQLLFVDCDDCEDIDFMEPPECEDAERLLQTFPEAGRVSDRTDPRVKAVNTVLRLLLKIDSLRSNSLWYGHTKPRIDLYDSLLANPSLRTVTPNALANFQKIVANTECVLACRNMHVFALIIGHELGHLIARHAEEEEQYEGLQAYVSELNACQAAKRSNGNCKGSHRRAISKAWDTEDMPAERFLEFNRHNEYEADYIGLMILAEAGFDPREAIEGWQEFVLGEKEYLNPFIPEESMAHPLSAKRIAAFKSYLPTAMELFNKAPSIDAKIQAIDWQNVRRGILKSWSRLRDDTHQSTPDPLALAALAKDLRDDIHPRLKTLEGTAQKKYGQMYILTNTDIERNISEATGDKEGLAEVLEVVYLRLVQVEQAMGFESEWREWKRRVATERKRYRYIQAHMRYLEDEMELELSCPFDTPVDSPGSAKDENEDGCYDLTRVSSALP